MSHPNSESRIGHKVAGYHEGLIDPNLRDRPSNRCVVSWYCSPDCYICKGACM